MASTTVRVKKETWEELRRLAEQSGEPMQEILAQAVEAYRRRHVLRAANKAFAAIRDDADAWKDEQEERRVWAATLSDGLEQ